MTYGTLPPTGYPAVSKWLHWLVALSVLVAVPVGSVPPIFKAGPGTGRLLQYAQVVRRAHLDPDDLADHQPVRRRCAGAGAGPRGMEAGNIERGPRIALCAADRSAARRLFGELRLWRDYAVLRSVRDAGARRQERQLSRPSFSPSIAGSESRSRCSSSCTSAAALQHYFIQRTAYFSGCCRARLAGVSGRKGQQVLMADGATHPVGRLSRRPFLDGALGHRSGLAHSAGPAVRQGSDQLTVIVPEPPRA